MKVTYKCECGNTRLKFECANPDGDFGYKCSKCHVYWGLTKNEEKVWDYVDKQTALEYEEKMKEVRNFARALKKVMENL